VATDMLDDLDLHLGNARHDNPKRFGGGSKRALRTLACSLQQIFSRIAVKNRTVLQASLAAVHQPRLDAFEARMVSIFSRLLRATGEDPQRNGCAIKALAQAAGTVSADTISTTNLIGSLQQVVLKGQGSMPPDIQASYGKIFSTLAKREDLRDVTVAALRSESALSDTSSVQLWRTFMTNDQARELSMELATGVQPKELEFDFVLDVINSAGVTANRPEISVDLSRKVLKSLKKEPNTLRNEAYGRVLKALRNSPYPDYERVMRREMRSGGILLSQ